MTRKPQSEIILALLQRGNWVRGDLKVEYSAWLAIRDRCNNPNNPWYRRYGGRGIKICARWGQFKNFLLDMGRKPKKGMSLDRKENDGNYTPGNCRWATQSQQMQNCDHYWRRKTHCLYGHPYSSENTYRGGGRRFCKACRNRRSREFRARGRAA